MIQNNSLIFLIINSFQALIIVGYWSLSFFGFFFEPGNRVSFLDGNEIYLTCSVVILFGTIISWWKRYIGGVSLIIASIVIMLYETFFVNNISFNYAILFFVPFLLGGIYYIFYKDIIRFKTNAL